MEFKDYYQILGIARDAPVAEIKKAFRKLARKYHPDVSKEPDADARMKEINEAYTVLSDIEKRAAYDQLGRDYRPGQDFHAPPDWDAGFEFSGADFSKRESAEFSDFFAELFGRMRAGADPKSASGGVHAHGEDHHAKILLDLYDAFTGAVRQISLRVPEADAQGRVRLATRTLKVKIPKGVRAGQIIRLAGQGASTLGTTPPGDLLLEVHFHPHPQFRLDHGDLYRTLLIAPWEAALGAIVPVATPLGEIKVRVPKGAQSGKQLRVRGKGLPSDPPGDLLLDVQVVVPPADTPQAEEAYRRMAEELAFDPRPER
jgi:curved DNA-binding protein